MIAMVVPEPPVDGRLYAVRICVGVRAVEGGPAAIGRTWISGCADHSLSDRANANDAGSRQDMRRMNKAIAMKMTIFAVFSKNSRSLGRFVCLYLRSFYIPI